MSEDDHDLTAKHWTYTTRCECCGELIDYVVPKKTDATPDEYTYGGFAAYVQTRERQQWLDCEQCGRMTLQTLVAYEREEAGDGR